MLVDFTGGLSSLSHAATHSMSSLHLNSVQLTDNGNYTCQPSGLQKVRPCHFLSFYFHIFKKLEPDSFITVYTGIYSLP